MGLFMQVDPPEVNEQTAPSRAPEPFKGVERVTRYQDHRPLLQYVEGMSWSVSYFSQVLNVDNETYSHSTDISGAFQQYRKLENFELKVTSPLEGSYETESAEWTLVGTANVYPTIKPNEGDLFVADYGDGRVGIFNIKLVEEKSYFEDTVYGIEFEFIRDYKGEAKEDLDKKVIQDLIVDRDRILTGASPIIREDYYADNKKLFEFEQQLIQHLYQNFIDEEEMAWRVPCHGYRLFDYQYSKMMEAILPDDSILKSSIRQLNLGNARHQTYTSFWDSLIERNRELLALADKHFYVTDKSQLYCPAVLNSAFYSSFNLFSLPLRFIKGAKRNVNLNAELMVRDIGKVFDIEFHCPESTEQPLIHPVNIDSCYVLSQMWYEEMEGTSVLEDLVSEYLRGTALDRTKFAKFKEMCWLWSPLEQFYYFPVLVILSRGARLHDDYL